MYLALKFVSCFTSTLMKMMELQNKTVHPNKFREMFKIILRPEMGKSERERRSFQFTHERGSFLAHIFGKFSFTNVSERGSLFCSRSRSFHVHFSFTEYPRNHSQGWNKIIFILFHPILLRIHKNRLPFKLLLHFEKKMLSTFFHFWSIKMLYYDRLVNVNWTWVNAQIFWALKSSRTWVNVAHNFKQMNVSDLAHEKCELAYLWIIFF